VLGEAKVFIFFAFLWMDFKDDRKHWFLSLLLDRRSVLPKQKVDAFLP
jgi:hypothetical protein